MHSLKALSLILGALFVPSAIGETIAEINGHRYLSPLKNQQVTSVSGLVTAVASSGIFLRSTKPDDDPRTSESIYVFSSSIGDDVSVGDIITLDGTVQEYRSSSDYLYLTEISSPGNVQVQSSNNAVKPLVIGKDTLMPPTRQYTSLDQGNVFGVPNNASLISVENPVLKPAKFGMDFWESLSGELVKVRKPVALNKPNSFGDTWVVGDWKVTGRNSRGGLTITNKDGNPEAILIQTPLDDSDNPLDTKLGDTLVDITGVVTYAFGSYSIRPRTALKVVKSRSPALPSRSNLIQSGDCKGITAGFYNVENLDISDKDFNRRAQQIVKYLRSPTILFLQEIQDNSGPTDNGVVSASKTLRKLAKSIRAAGGPHYDFIEINPLDDTTGGEPGGNIRVAYLYNPKVVALTNPNPGNAVQANRVLAGPKLKYNPGFIAPNSTAWTESRRPLAAQWHTVRGPRSKFFTVNMHDTSKGGSTSLFGDPRPPVNLGIDQRAHQTTVVAKFVAQILKRDADANVIVAGDFNEFAYALPQKLFIKKSGLKELDVVAGLPPVERYSYLFVQNSQELDHVYISHRIAAKKPKLDRVHINTWVSYNDQVSDHDPSVAKFNLCGAT